MSPELQITVNSIARRVGVQNLPELVERAIKRGWCSRQRVVVVIPKPVEPPAPKPEEPPRILRPTLQQRLAASSVCPDCQKNYRECYC